MACSNGMKTGRVFEKEINFIRSCYPGKTVIPLHEPILGEKENEYVRRAVDSGFVSSVGAYVDEFERMLCRYTGARHAVATVNGTAALHIAMMVAGVREGDIVLTQPLTFAATANAIRYCGAEPLFLDIDEDTLGLSPGALKTYINSGTELKKEGLCDRSSGRHIAACLPVHIFGNPCRIDKIVEICQQYQIPLLEDAAEAMGTRYQDRHAGCFGLAGTLSFNGNKIITAGGGGAVITNSEAVAREAKHLSTTARVADEIEFFHDRIGYNYRMPNLNAALACAQLTQLDDFIEKKKHLAEAYQDFFAKSPDVLIKSIPGASPNFWLNCVIMDKAENRDLFLRELIGSGILARPVWRLINRLDMYRNCRAESLAVAEKIAARAVCLPSSVPA
jgi:aminotransferase in exopolysaccharide biosynthesis